jgi:hypothetical protein
MELDLAWKGATNPSPSNWARDARTFNPCTLPCFSLAFLRVLCGEIFFVVGQPFHQEIGNE